MANFGTKVPKVATDVPGTHGQELNDRGENKDSMNEDRIEKVRTSPVETIKRHFLGTFTVLANLVDEHGKESVFLEIQTQQPTLPHEHLEKMLKIGRDPKSLTLELLAELVPEVSLALCVPKESANVPAPVNVIGQYEGNYGPLGDLPPTPQNPERPFV
jgi:hypothetical protein